MLVSPWSLIGVECSTILLATAESQFESSNQMLLHNRAICADIWQMINPIDHISPRALPFHLLWGLMLIEVYSTEDVPTGIAGDRKKLFEGGQWACLFIDATAQLSYSLVTRTIVYNAEPNPHFYLLSSFSA